MPLVSLPNPERLRRTIKCKAEKRYKKQRTYASGRVLIGPSKLLKREIADDLWTPGSSALQDVRKPGMVSGDRTIAPDETSAHVVGSPGQLFKCVSTNPRGERGTCQHCSPRRNHQWMSALGEMSEGHKKPVNSILKLRLLLTTSQRKKLEHMFGSNRAVNIKLVAL